MILNKSWTSEAAVRVKPSLVEVKWFSRLLKKYFGLAGVARWGFPSHVVMWPCCLFEITTLFMHIFLSSPSPLGKQPCGHYSCSQHPHKKNKTTQCQSRHTKTGSAGAVGAVSCEVLPVQDEHCSLFSTTKTMCKHNPNLRTMDTRVQMLNSFIRSFGICLWLSIFSWCLFI